jgi:DNA repair protein RadA/Sms
VIGHIEAVDPDLLVIDSIQTLATADLDGSAGGVTQVRAVTAALVRIAKQRHLPTLLVGHVTKDGSIAGPRALEHIVDVVLQFEGERNSRLRILRAYFDERHRPPVAHKIVVHVVIAGLPNLVDPSIVDPEAMFGFLIRHNLREPRPS